MMKLVLTVILLLLAPLAVQAHGEEETVAQSRFPDPVTTIFYSLIVIILVSLISILLRNKLKNKHKKILFALILIPVMFSTIYLAGSTVYTNLISETGGPVHWHADYEIWICGEKVLLKEPEGFDNKVGSATLHHHNEGKDLGGKYRIHVEGVLVKKQAADLSSFFEKTGNLLQKDSIGLFLHDGSQKRWFNGDTCSNTGKNATLKVFVNDGQIEDFTEYVISPYSNVPPGDFIRIVFD